MAGSPVYSSVRSYLRHFDIFKHVKYDCLSFYRVSENVAKINQIQFIALRNGSQHIQSFSNLRKERNKTATTYCSASNAFLKKKFVVEFYQSDFHIALASNFENSIELFCESNGISCIRELNFSNKNAKNKMHCQFQLENTHNKSIRNNDY